MVVILVILTGLLHPLLATIASGVLAIISRGFRKVFVVIAVAYALMAVFLTAYGFANPASTTFGP